MNDWMVKDLEWDDKFVPNRGKVLDEDALEDMEQFHRYLDLMETEFHTEQFLVCIPKGHTLQEGSGHNKFGGYTEDADEYQDVVDRLLIKWETAKSIVPSPIKEFKKKTRWQYSVSAVVTMQ